MTAIADRNPDMYRYPEDFAKQLSPVPHHEPDWIVEADGPVTDEQVAAFREAWKASPMVMLPKGWKIRPLRDPKWEPQPVLSEAIWPSTWDRLAPWMLAVLVGNGIALVSFVVVILLSAPA